MSRCTKIVKNTEPQLLIGDAKLVDDGIYDKNRQNYITSMKLHR